MHYKGNCHCGKIKFSLDGDLTGATSCNCSICQRKGHLLWFVPAAQVRLDALPQDVGTYTFNKHHIAHHFCKICGVSPYADGATPTGDKMIAINIRCIEDINLTNVPIKEVNGRAL
jgi:hypothetical protein